MSNSQILFMRFLRICFLFTLLKSRWGGFGQQIISSLLQDPNFTSGSSMMIHLYFLGDLFLQLLLSWWMTYGHLTVVWAWRIQLQLSYMVFHFVKLIRHLIKNSLFSVLFFSIPKEIGHGALSKENICATLWIQRALLGLYLQYESIYAFSCGLFYLPNSFHKKINTPRFMEFTTELFMFWVVPSGSIVLKISLENTASVGLWLL